MQMWGWSQEPQLIHLSQVFIIIFNPSPLPAGAGWGGAGRVRGNLGRAHPTSRIFLAPSAGIPMNASPPRPPSPHEGQRKNVRMGPASAQMQFLGHSRVHCCASLFVIKIRFPSLFRLNVPDFPPNSWWLSNTSSASHPGYPQKLYFVPRPGTRPGDTGTRGCTVCGNEEDTAETFYNTT